MIASAMGWIGTIGSISAHPSAVTTLRGRRSHLTVVEPVHRRHPTWSPWEPPRMTFQGTGMFALDNTTAAPVARVGPWTAAIRSTSMGDPR